MKIKNRILFLRIKVYSNLEFKKKGFLLLNIDQTKKFILKSQT